MAHQHSARAHLIISEPITTIRQVLRDAAAYPQWNPALDEVRQTGEGRFAVTARKVLRGRMRLEETERHFTTTITLPGLREISHWQLHFDGHATHITHVMHWRGPLAGVIGGREIRTVAAKRLRRLQELCAGA